MSGMDTGGIQRVIDRRHEEWFAERERDRAARAAGRDPDPRDRFQRARVLLASAADRVLGMTRRPDRESTPGTWAGGPERPIGS